MIHQVVADRGIAPVGTKGAAQHLRGIAAGFVAAGRDVATYARRRPDGPFPVPVRRLDDLDGAVGLGDVVYERYSLGHVATQRLAQAAGACHVLEVNAPLVEEATAHRPDTVGPDDRAAEAELLRRAALVVTVSEQLADWVGHHRSGPTVVVPNGFEPAWFGQSAPASRPRYDLVFLGHPKPWHGADRLPGLVAALRARGRDVTLLVVGGGTGADRLREAADHSGVGDLVTVTGALPPAEASALLASARIGIAPYPPQEPFYFCPLKVVDYVAAGLPVVASDLGDIARIAGPAGVLVDAADDRALVDAVAELLADDRRRRAVGQAGRDHAWAHLTWGQRAVETLQAIDALTSVPSVRAVAS